MVYGTEGATCVAMTHAWAIPFHDRLTRLRKGAWSGHMHRGNHLRQQPPTSQHRANSTSYAARHVASSLAARGLHKGDVFALYCPNLPDYAIAVHGVL
jgi:hypothetical protein